MEFLLLSMLPGLVLASPVEETLSVAVEPKQTINGTVEYVTQCKSCPYTLCTNVLNPWYDEIVTLTCWTNGDEIGDTDLWLKTVDNCYLTEYDLIEYEGDFSQDLAYCGEVPLDITEEDAEIRYLSECKWGYSTADETMMYYGRDVDVTLTCWAEGDTVLENPYWYKTTDNCHVSGTGLWEEPDHADLDNCGPHEGPRANETRRSMDGDEAHPAPIKLRNEEENGVARRWLQAEQIGEEYAPCFSCPNTPETSCRRLKRYEFNDTVVSQCYTNKDYTYPNGSFSSSIWMLTTDWCYVEEWQFWEPPWDHYRYPNCANWPGYE